jgi:replicative DNA helicase
MRHQELTRRILADEAAVPSNVILAGLFDDEGRVRLAEASKRIDAAPFFIDETGGISMAKLAMRARRMKRQHGISLLVVDYLQLMSASQKRGQNRTQEISELSGGLKVLAKELEVPLLALSQLTREVEKRDDKRPNMSDLRDGGSIEQDADVVMFVYREEYYWLKANPKPIEAGGQADWIERWRQDGKKGIAEVIIAKQRNGPTGTVLAQYEGEYTRFSNLARDAR